MALAAWLSRLHRRTAAGRALRQLLRVVPSGRTVRVLSGPLRGAYWVTGGPASYWLGFFESDFAARIATMVRGGSVVYDIGANEGYYTLLASRRCGWEGRVLAFEPNPPTYARLRTHITLNRCGNVEPRIEAVGATTGLAWFQPGSDDTEGHLAESGTCRVQCVTVDSVVAGGAPPPDLLKIDVEGAEAAVLSGATKTLAIHQPVILLAVHGPQQRESCCHLLAGAGYSLRWLDGATAIASPEAYALRPEPVPG